MKKGVLLIIIGFLAASCGGSASAPTTPAQVPTSTEYIATPTTVEYAGGAVTGDISVQMGKTLSFIIKDETGATITNLEDYTLTPKFSVLSAIESLSAKSLNNGKATEVTDGSCGSASASNSTLLYTAPLNWAGVASRCQMTVEYQSTALTGTFSQKISLSPTVASEDLTFASGKIFTNSAEGAIDIDDDGIIHMCYRSLSGSWGINYTKSSDTGTTWSTPVELISGNKETRCVIAASRDGSKVAVAWKYDGTGARGDEDKERMAYSSNSGSSFSTPVTYLTGPTEVLRPSIVMDSSGTAHIASSTSTTKLATACTTTCGTPTTVVTSSSSDIEPRLVISTNDVLHMIWDDTRNGAANTDVFIAQLTYNGTSYSLGTNYQLTSSASLGTDVRDTNATLDRNNVPVITWTSFVDTTPYSSYIYLAEWNPVSATQSTPARISDVDPLILPYLSSPFISYDNYKHVLYVSYGANLNDGNSWYTMQNDSGGFIASKQIEITGFVYQRTTTNLKTDIVGHPYIIWDYVTYSNGALTASDIYFAKGTL